MADTFANSYDSSQPNMLPYPLYLQAVGGDAAINYAAADFRELITAIWPQSGGIRASDFVVSQRAAGANFSVDISAGRGVVLGTSVPEQGCALVRATGVVNLTTPSAPGSGSPRVHRIVVELLDKQAAGSLYGWRYHLLEDTGSGEPAAPASSFTIASVGISVGQVSVTNANIGNTPNIYGFAKYTAAISATGQNQALATNATTAIQMINARTPSVDVTASGTNNTAFAVNKAGPWSFDCGARITPGTTGAHFVQLVRNDTGELVAAAYPGVLSTGSTYDIPLCGSDYFASAGISVSLNVVTGAGVAGSVINSGLVSTGLRTFVAMRYKGV